MLGKLGFPSELYPNVMAAKKTAKKAAAKKAAKKPTEKPAKKAAAKKAPAKKATKVAKAASKVEKKAGPSIDSVARSAYLNYRRRVENGLPGDSHGDWLEAERQLRENG